MYNCLDVLSLEKPDYISVTYGAGGNTKGRTVEIANRIKSHIENILSLRGDYPVDRELESGDFNYAKDLINYIREKKGDKFSIGAAYYVEGHRETNDLLDLFYLKEKVNAGVDFLISQIFLDNEFFYSFRDKLEKLQINVPLVAGIIPVTNAKQ